MGAQLTVIVSGCHSGPNPSPGIGIARSLRAAFPDCRLIAHDAASSSTGLSADVFDGTSIGLAMSDPSGATSPARLLDDLNDAWLISGLDLELRDLTRLDLPRILVPTESALDAVAKPMITAASRLPVKIPAWIPLSNGEAAVQRFCRHHDWRLWVKGPVYDGRPVTSWADLRLQARLLERTWGADGIFVQAHVAGEGVSVAFAALRGELLDAVLLEKCSTTEQGKVWTGAIAPIPGELHTALRDVVHDLRWTGGGELEFVRDQTGQLWLFDWNPRFPAWIHGATLAGHNLPGALLEAATGITAKPSSCQSARFVRQVVEVPARDGLEIPRERAVMRGPGASKKWAKATPSFVGRPVSGTGSTVAGPAPAIPLELTFDLRDAASTLDGTPARVLLHRTAERRFANLSRLARRAGIRTAYSLKTNPNPAILKLARQHGLMAEAIGREEIDWALECGFRPSEILVNGPVPISWPLGQTPQLAAAFADDVEGLELYLRKPPARVIGVRLRPPFLPSRFGVPLESHEHVQQLIALVGRAPARQALGFSFHAASSELGRSRWERLAGSVIDWAAKLSELAGRQISLLDLGGGWAPDDFDEAVEDQLLRLAGHARAKLGDVVEVVIEPGKALAQPSQAVLTRVVHFRRGAGGFREAILDAGIGDVPQVAAHPHRLAAVRGGEVSGLEPGRDRLFGPLCMESDVLAEGVHLPDDLAVGELVAICDAGAYDASMTFTLGRGAALQRSARKSAEAGRILEPVTSAVSDRLTS